MSDVLHSLEDQHRFHLEVWRAPSTKRRETADSWMISSKISTSYLWRDSCSKTSRSLSSPVLYPLSKKRGTPSHSTRSSQLSPGCLWSPPPCYILEQRHFTPYHAKTRVAFYLYSVFRHCVSVHLLFLNSLSDNLRCWFWSGGAASAKSTTSPKSTDGQKLRIIFTSM